MNRAKRLFGEKGCCNMKKAEKISGAIGNIEDRFLLEACAYKANPVIYRRIIKIGITAACVCAAILSVVLLQTGGRSSITVYAYESGEQVAYGQPALWPGQVSEEGIVKNLPLKFYILGKGIEKIRFSCKNEWIAFNDWKEQRENYGYSRNFTISYGEDEEDYYNLVIEWCPEKMGIKIQEGLSDLPWESKEDIIVMEVTYLDGGSETLAMNISVSGDGKLLCGVSDYEITAEDDFVFQPDNITIQEGDRRREQVLQERLMELEEALKQREQELMREVEQKVQKFGNEMEGIGAESEEGGEEVRTGEGSGAGGREFEQWESWEDITTELSEEELARVFKVIGDYYAYVNIQAGEPIQIASNYRNRSYKGYDVNEVAVFQMSGGQTITVGSKDGWQHCVVLNEGIDVKISEEMTQMLKLTEEELARVEETIEAYYAHTVHKPVYYSQIPSKYANGSLENEYDIAEVVVFEVATQASRVNRTIVIGSKDGWTSCTVLNEGY